MKKTYLPLNSFSKMRKILLLFSFVIFTSLISPVFAQTVDIGITESPSGTFNVYLKPAQDITGVALDNLQFTIKWPNNTVNPQWNTLNYSITEDGAEQFYNGFRYQKFSGSPGSALNWTGGMEYLVLQFTFIRTGTACSGAFEIGNDTYTNNAPFNGQFEIIVNSTDYTGLLYSNSAGDLSPIFINSSAHTDIDCFGNTNGEINVSASGIFTPISYSIDGTNFQSTGVFDQLSGGDYTVIVRDVNYCTKSVAITIDEPSALSSSGTVTDVTGCFGNETGQIQATSTGGTPSYTYSIGGGFQASTLFDNLAAGSYTLTTKDDNGCTASTILQIDQPNPITLNQTANDVYPCYGDDNGTISVSASGDFPPFDYSLNSGPYQSTGSFTALAAGTYSVLVQDANNCTTTTEIEITQPDDILIVSQSSTDIVTCYGDPYGFISLVATGGTQPLSYSVDGANFQGNGSFNNLYAGDYTVIVQDDNGCTKNVDFTITQPDEIIIDEIDVTNVLCNGAETGQISISASGGSPPLYYSKDGFNYQSGTNFSNLPAGTYNVTIKDSHNCTKSEETEITEPSPITIDMQSSTDVSQCAGNSDGSITVIASGGAEPLGYSIDGVNFQPAGQFTALSAGNYTVTITDQNGCLETLDFTISEPDAIEIANEDITDVSCNGGDNGEIAVMADGGTGTLQFSLDGGDLQPSGTFSNLAAGFYQMVIKDGNNCTLEKNYTVDEPTAISMTNQSQNNVTCYGGNSGQVYITANGGTGLLLFSINSIDWQNNGLFEDLTEGTYKVKTRDENMCYDSINVYISQPDEIVITDQIVNNSTTCNDNDGSITVIANGGTPPLVYSLNNSVPQSSGVFENLYPGDYTVTVSDANDCEVVLNLTITQSEPIIIETFETQDVSCNGQNDGTITIAATGGAPPLEYSINGITFQSSGEFTGLPPDNYPVTVRDVNNCTETEYAYINEPNPLVATPVSVVNVLGCYGDATGAIEVAATGGTPPLEYSVDGSNFVTSPLFENLTAGIYNVTVRDVNLCTSTLELQITEPPQLVADLSAVQISCNGEQDGASDLDVTGGTLPYSFSWSCDSITQNVSNLQPGSYTVTVTDNNGCTSTAAMDIVEPPELNVSIDVIDISCNGANDGQIDVTALGGTGPYTYNWLPDASQSEDRQNLVPGFYTVRITDSYNCTTSATANITEPPKLTGSIEKTDVSYIGQSDGELDLSVFGGTEPYSYLWSNGSNTEDITNLPVGDYAVYVTDNNGCQLYLTKKIEPLTTEVTDIPNAFSPNGDGVNDKWVVQNIAKYPNATLKIFDVHGNIVYEEEGSIQPWNGTDNNGIELPSQTVYYYVIVLDTNGRTAPLTGSITIIR